MCVNSQQSECNSFVDEEKNKNKYSGAEAEKQNQKTQQKPNKQIELN